MQKICIHETENFNGKISIQSFCTLVVGCRAMPGTGGAFVRPCGKIFTCKIRRKHYTPPPGRPWSDVKTESTAKNYVPRNIIFFPFYLFWASTVFVFVCRAIIISCSWSSISNNDSNKNGMNVRNSYYLSHGERSVSNYTHTEYKPFDVLSRAHMFRL